jgi:hypothetical protein
MRKSLQSIFLTGLMTVGGFLLQSVAHAQHEYYWGNPDIPYVDQRSFSLGLSIGQTDLWGDVGTKSVKDHYLNKNYTSDVLGNMRFMGGMFVRYNHVPGIAFRLSVNYGSLYATDEWNEEKGLKAKTIQDDAFQRYVRNLDVSNNIWEGSFLFEFSPLQISNWEFGKLAKSKVQPYLMIGVAGFHFNPQGTYKNMVTGQKTLVDLQPLHTEGENFEAPGYTFPENYSLWSYAGIAGIGVRFDIGRGLGLGLEYQLRYTFTDYLDDVSGQYIDPQHFDIGYLNENGKSQAAWKMADRSTEIIPGYHHQPGEYRGDPSNNDMYSSVSVMFFWRIKKRAIPWWN